MKQASVKAQIVRCRCGAVATYLETNAEAVDRQIADLQYDRANAEVELARSFKSANGSVVVDAVVDLLLRKPALEGEWRFSCDKCPSEGFGRPINLESFTLLQALDLTIHFAEKVWFECSLVSWRKAMAAMFPGLR